MLVVKVMPANGALLLVYRLQHRLGALKDRLEVATNTQPFRVRRCAAADAAVRHAGTCN